MIEPDTTALIVLAAGRSSRFGASDKLAQEWLGQPLGLHVARNLKEIPFLRRVAVVGGGDLDYRSLGYELVVNPTPGLGMSLSIRLAADHVRGQGHEAILIVLADMPRVTAGHVLRLFEQADGQRR